MFLFDWSWLLFKSFSRWYIWRTVLSYQVDPSLNYFQVSESPNIYFLAESSQNQGVDQTCMIIFRFLLKFSVLSRSIYMPVIRVRTCYPNEWNDPPCNTLPYSPKWPYVRDGNHMLCSFEEEDATFFASLACQPITLVYRNSSTYIFTIWYFVMLFLLYNNFIYITKMDKKFLYLI